MDDDIGQTTGELSDKSKVNVIKKEILVDLAREIKKICGVHHEDNNIEYATYNDDWERGLNRHILYEKSGHILDILKRDQWEYQWVVDALVQLKRQFEKSHEENIIFIMVYVKSFQETEDTWVYCLSIFIVSDLSNFAYVMDKVSGIHPDVYRRIKRHKVNLAKHNVPLQPFLIKLLQDSLNLPTDRNVKETIEAIIECGIKYSIRFSTNYDILERNRTLIRKLLEYEDILTVQQERIHELQSADLVYKEKIRELQSVELSKSELPKTELSKIENKLTIQTKSPAKSSAKSPGPSPRQKIKRSYTNAKNRINLRGFIEDIMPDEIIQNKISRQKIKRSHESHAGLPLSGGGPWDGRWIQVYRYLAGGPWDGRIQVYRYLAGP